MTENTYNDRYENRCLLWVTLLAYSNEFRGISFQYKYDRHWILILSFSNIHHTWGSTKYGRFDYEFGNTGHFSSIYFVITFNAILLNQKKHTSKLEPQTHCRISCRHSVHNYSCSVPVCLAKLWLVLLQPRRYTEYILLRKEYNARWIFFSSINLIISRNNNFRIFIHVCLYECFSMSVSIV